MTQIWAHRGAAGLAPENTLAAFELALEQGAEGIEFDVQLSEDGAPVVIHDESVDRTTNGTGAVQGYTLAELQRLDASAGQAGFADARIPTLSQVLELAAPTSVAINIELKNSEVDYPGLEEVVLAAVADFDLAERVVLSSFNHHSLRRLAKLGTDSQLAMLYSDPLVKAWRYAARVGVAALHPPARYLLRRRYVTRAHAAGLAVRPWVVNSEAVLRRMLEFGVDAVFTDRPDLALASRSAYLEGRP